MPTVLELLQDARQAHRAYRGAAPKMVNGRLVVDLSTALASVVKARQARLDAGALDPTHSDPAWTEDDDLGFPNAPLLTYYRKKILGGILPHG